MEIDVLLYFEEYCEIDIQLFCWDEDVNIRYIIMTPSMLFERFDDYYSMYGLEKVRVLSIGTLSPFHYLTFYSFLKSNLRRSVDKYIITTNYNVIEIKSLLELVRAGPPSPFVPLVPRPRSPRYVPLAPPSLFELN